MANFRKFKKILVANRSEIAIRVFRTASELDIRTVAVYSHEDRFALHRFKADEAYRIGKPGEPIRSYLGIEEIVALAKSHQVDAIHPGYGFLSENANFAQAVQKVGIAFVGPRPEVLEKLGDKVQARKLAKAAKVPILSGSEGPIKQVQEAQAIATALGYPVIIKASMGGGGRGMRVVESPDRLAEALEQAQREAGNAFGIPDVFIEKFIRKARHIEVQLLGDSHGGMVHLFERDCSVQRRHQKVVEIAPAPNLAPKLRNEILEAALAIGRTAGIDNVATVEFLVDADTNGFFFIEVNPRIQVEHTVTEQVTGVDLIKAQILVAQGMPLSHAELGLGKQSDISLRGYAIQCRVTTEDPLNNFLPDYGKLSNYRSASGMGIRLDAGSAFTGAVINPFYDSLLVKVTASGLRFENSAKRMLRTLQEFRIRGVKTNIPFLINLVNHPGFLAGTCTTRFIDETPELLDLPVRQDRATRLLRYIADIIVNGHPDIPQWDPPVAPEPELSHSVQAALLETPPEGTRNLLQRLGPEQFSKWLRSEKILYLTDTTFRDAHQSLLATRMRSRDMARVAPFYASRLSHLFSLEMWGGATFDTAMRFLKESPWDRLADLRASIPNILFQMLLRSANAVGYTSYPDNVVHGFVKESAQAGIDLFRVFDSLNGLPNLGLAIEAVRNTGMLCEAAICYTGDILDPARKKYDLRYYVQLAKELEKRGANILAIKDMAGLCKPWAAARLVKALREEVSLPVHFHTHDCAGGQIASLLFATQEGVDVVDVAMAPFAGMNSQPSLHALAEALRFHPRDPGLDPKSLVEAANYWESVRPMYAPFESGQLAPTADVYVNEMPGGQYTNLFQQAKALGLADRWRDVCAMYSEVNQMFGDIIKVTPTSKVVGDLALFMVGNNLSRREVEEAGRELSFPESVVEFFEGRLGEPPGGFPEKLQQRVLRGKKQVQGRPGAALAPADFPATKKQLEQTTGIQADDQSVLSYLLYSKVFTNLVDHQKKFSDTSVLPTPVFFFGLQPGMETSIEIEKGKVLILKFLTVGDPHADGTRTVFFELNGQPREVVTMDKSLAGKSPSRPKTNASNPLEAGAPMPGVISKILVASGEEISTGQKLFVLEAMKMETTVYAEKPGIVSEITVSAGTHVEGGDLIVRLSAV
ncbi:MAG: pyruvate carboxylase [Gemmataceae bacterium]|nr:pyruvate carboxylase [Gemmataceae bacterium]